MHLNLGELRKFSPRTLNLKNVLVSLAFQNLFCVFFFFVVHSKVNSSNKNSCKSDILQISINNW